MKRQTFAQKPWIVRARVRVAQLDMGFQSHAAALLCFERYTDSFSELDAEAEILLFHYGEPVLHWVKEEHAGMGKLAEVYKSNDFLTPDDKAHLATNEYLFKVTAVRESTSKISGTKQYIFQIELDEPCTSFDGVVHVFSLDADANRDKAVKVMREDISQQGFYGPVYLTRNGRYYIFKDLDEK